jgi:hypothetical protein
MQFLRIAVLVTHLLFIASARVVLMASLDLEQGLTLHQMNISSVSQGSRIPGTMIQSNKSSLLQIRAGPNPNADTFSPSGDRARGPEFLYFPGEQLVYMKQAWLEMLDVASVAYESVCKRNKAFRRYFAWEDMEKVQAMFNAVRGPDGLGALLFSSLPPLHVIYGDPALFQDPRINECLSPQGTPTGLLASLFRNRDDVLGPGQTPGSILWVCPRAFEKFKRPLWGHTCAERPDRMAVQFTSLGGILLHELMHITELCLEAGLPRILDYGSLADGSRDPSITEEPLDGYTPWRAMLVNYRHKNPLGNADNFHFMAVESWWM